MWVNFCDRWKIMVLFHFILLHENILFSQHNLLKILSFLYWIFLTFLSNITWKCIKGFISRILILFLYHCPTVFTTIALSSVQFSCSVMSNSFVSPWTAAHQASLSINNSQSLLRIMSIESVMASDCLFLCCPLLLLPSIFPSIRVFSNDSVLCIRWSKYWSFSFSISLSNEYSVLISFRIDGWISWSPRDSQESSTKPQFKNIISSALSSVYSPTVTSMHDYWKNHSFDYMDFFGRVMSLFFNILSRLVIAFLPRSKCLLIS